MPNSKEYIERNKDKIKKYMREYYLKNSTRKRMVPGDERQEKVCKKCAVLKGREEFFVRKSGSRVGHLSAYCRGCSTDVHLAGWSKDPERMQHISWRSKIKRLYGLTEEKYNEMLEKQGGACAICKSTVSWSRNYKHKKNGSSRFMVDHCHETGRVRGLLCTRCNRALGLLGDSRELFLRAVEYLHQAKQKQEKENSVGQHSSD
jgi:hypothetical protein